MLEAAISRASRYGRPIHPYLEPLRDAFARAPRLHAHQLTALQAGALGELARAAHLDRLTAEVRVAAAVGDGWRARAASLERAAVAAAAPEAWPAARDAEAEQLREQSATGPAAHARFVNGVIRHRTVPAVEAAAIEPHLEGLMAAAAGTDPQSPPCRLRRPWPALDDLIEIPGVPPMPEIPPATDITAAWEQALVTADLGGELPPAEQVAAGYRGLADAVGPDDPLHPIAVRMAAVAAGAADAVEAQALLQAEGLPGRLAAAPERARARAGLDRQAVWPDPLAEHHWRALDTALTDVRTATEAEAAILHAGACFAVEADWNLVFLGVLLAPLRSALLGEPARAAGVARMITGLSAPAIARAPRVRAIVERAFAGDAPSVATEGEAGWDFLQAVGTSQRRDLPTLPTWVDEDPDPPKARLWDVEFDLREAFPPPVRPGV